MNTPVKHSTIYCERCGKILDPKKAVWLELSNTDGKYYPEGELQEGHVSQGGFSFGKACAVAQLKETLLSNLEIVKTLNNNLGQ
jgi:hypothetical protein